MFLDSNLGFVWYDEWNVPCNEITDPCCLVRLNRQMRMNGIKWIDNRWKYLQQTQSTCDTFFAYKWKSNINNKCHYWKTYLSNKYHLTYKWKSNINKYQWTLFEVGTTNWLIEITDKQKHTYQLVKPGSTKNQKHSYKMQKNY